MLDAIQTRVPKAFGGISLRNVLVASCRFQKPTDRHRVPEVVTRSHVVDGDRCGVVGSPDFIGPFAQKHTPGALSTTSSNRHGLLWVAARLVLAVLLSCCVSFASPNLPRS
jgi:hypothetical protein